MSHVLFSLLLTMQQTYEECEALTQKTHQVLTAPKVRLCRTIDLHALARQAQRSKLESCFIHALEKNGVEGHPFDSLTNQEPLEQHKDNHKDAVNVFGGDVSLFETDNFAIWWGESTAFEQTHITTLGEHFEVIWDVQINALGYPAPESSDALKVNVYIGDTHPDLPSAEGNAGYFWYDPEGRPMLVLSQDIIAYPDSAKLTAAHEFFHAVQSAVGTYQFQDQALWYLEATANWILEEVFTADGGYSNTLYAVAMRPEFPLNHFGDYTTDGLEADHHYGAFIFATYLSEHVGGPDFIRDSFVEANVGADPLLVIDALLAEHDSNIHVAHLDYAMHNATWDYRFESDYEASVSDAASLGESHRVSGYLDGLSSEWTAEIAYPPFTYGANYWRLTNMPDRFYLDFEGESGVQWSVGLASQSGSDHVQRPLFHQEEETLVMVKEWQNTPQNWLVVSAIEDVVDRGDPFTYRFRLRSVEDVEAEGTSEPDSEEPAGFGCTSVPATGGSHFILMALVLLFRKKLLPPS